MNARGRVYALVVALVVGTEGIPGSTMAHTMSKVEADLEATEPSARVTNEPMPALLLEDESGSVVRLAELQGKVVILSFENEQSSSLN